MPTAVPTNTRRPILLTVALTLPFALAWLQHERLAETSPRVQQVVYTAGKLLQFALPLIWWAALRRAGRANGTSARRPPALSRATSWWYGAVTGGVILTGMLLLHHFWLNTSPSMKPAADALSSKLVTLGLNSPARFLAFGCFVAAAHSLLEEIYWRWFVLGGLLDGQHSAWSLPLSSMAFASFHLVHLAGVFGWTPLTWLFTGAVAAGGLMWGWLFLRTRHLGGIWLSHAMADIGVFWVGYELLRSG